MNHLARVRIVKNELGRVSNTAGTKGLGGHNGMNRGTGGGVKPPTPVNSNPAFGIHWLNNFSNEGSIAWEPAPGGQFHQIAGAPLFNFCAHPILVGHCNVFRRIELCNNTVDTLHPPQQERYSRNSHTMNISQNALRCFLYGLLYQLIEIFLVLGRLMGLVLHLRCHVKSWLDIVGRRTNTAVCSAWTIKLPSILIEQYECQMKF